MLQRCLGARAERDVPQTPRVTELLYFRKGVDFFSRAVHDFRICIGLMLSHHISVHLDQIIVRLTPSVTRRSVRHFLFFRHRGVSGKVFFQKPMFPPALLPSSSRIFSFHHFIIVGISTTARLDYFATWMLTFYYSTLQLEQRKRQNNHRLESEFPLRLHSKVSRLAPLRNGG